MLWLIEAPKGPGPMAMTLASNCAVRLFASLDSLEQLIEIEDPPPPRAVVVRSDHFRAPPMTFDERLAFFLPGVERIFVGPCAKALRSGLQGSLAAPELRTILEFESPSQCCVVIKSRAFHQSNNKSEGHGQVVAYRDLCLDMTRSTLRVLGSEKEESLSLKESQLLTLFMRRSGTCVTRDEILHHVWSSQKVSDSTISSQVSRLRRRLDLSQTSLDSVYGGGYVLR